MILIFNDKEKAIKYADEIHVWLTKNRKDYRAEKWCDIEAGKDETGLQFYVKVPPDYEELNIKLEVKDKLEVSKDAVMTLAKLPVDWKTIKDK